MRCNNYFMWCTSCKETQGSCTTKYDIPNIKICTHRWESVTGLMHENAELAEIYVYNAPLANNIMYEVSIVFVLHYYYGL